MTWPHKSPKTSGTLQQQMQPALLTWRWADFCLLLTAAHSNVGGSAPEVSDCVNWLTGTSCWAPQHPHFIWPIITQRSLVSKYHRCNTGGQVTPAWKNAGKRYVSPARGNRADKGSGAPTLAELTAGQRWWGRSRWAANSTAEVPADGEISTVERTAGSVWGGGGGCV